jgi:hypothetical protein
MIVRVSLFGSSSSRSPVPLAQNPSECISINICSIGSESEQERDEEELYTEY